MYSTFFKKFSESYNVFVSYYCIAHTGSTSTVTIELF